MDEEVCDNCGTEIVPPTVPAGTAGPVKDALLMCFPQGEIDPDTGLIVFPLGEDDDELATPDGAGGFIDNEGDPLTPPATDVNGDPIDPDTMYLIDALGGWCVKGDVNDFITDCNVVEREGVGNVALGGVDQAHTIVGGARTDYCNQILGQGFANTVAGGGNNTIHDGSVNYIGGGGHNQINPTPSADAGYHNYIGAGSLNTIDAPDGTRTDYAFIGAGTENQVNSNWSAILAGARNFIHQLSKAAGIFVGRDNILGADGFSSDNAAITHGRENKLGTLGSAIDSGIIGGARNTVDGSQNTSVGGEDHVIEPGVTDAGIFAGARHTLKNAAHRAAFLGGQDNIVEGTAARSVVLGGQNITATEPDTAYVPGLNADLPTSAAGLPTGTLWNNAGVVNIV